MKLKKTAKIILTCAVVGTVLTGCGENSSLPQDTVQIGMLKNLNANELMYEKFMKKFEENANINLKHHNVIFYGDLQSLQLDLDAGKIEEISIYKCSADYLMSINPQIEIAKNHVGKKKIIDNIAFALRDEDIDLKNSLNAAIESMKNDGTLENLITNYITDFKAAEDTPVIEFENFDGAEILKIGVTGDLPPLDLILENGTPAGFNTAILSEVGKRLQKNIEVVKIDSATRAEALKLKKVDISFWAIIPTNEAMPRDIDKPQDVELSAPYFTDDVVHIDRIK